MSGQALIDGQFACSGKIKGPPILYGLSGFTPFCMAQRFFSFYAAR
jgi:hypothetical protein